VITLKFQSTLATNA